MPMAALISMPFARNTYASAVSVASTDFATAYFFQHIIVDAIADARRGHAALLFMAGDGFLKLNSGPKKVPGGQPATMIRAGFTLSLGMRIYAATTTRT